MATGYCIDQDSTSNAVTTVNDEGCGGWTGESNHRYVQSGATTNIQLGRETQMYAGECSQAQVCQQLGPEYNWDGFQCQYNPGSPILIAVGLNDTYRLTSAEDGVLFDVTGDGVAEQVAWTQAESGVAFLAMDRDGDGMITSGRELFGNQTIPGAENGFDALRMMSLASNGGIQRGNVSVDDPIFSELLLWTDTNHNGISEPDELRPAGEVLSAIGLGYHIAGRRDKHGNLFAFKGWAHVRTGPGRNKATTAKESYERSRPIWDAFLKIAQ